MYASFFFSLLIHQSDQIFGFKDGELHHEDDLCEQEDSEKEWKHNAHPIWSIKKVSKLKHLHRNGNADKDLKKCSINEFFSIIPVLFAATSFSDSLALDSTLYR